MYLSISVSALYFSRECISKGRTIKLLWEGICVGNEGGIYYVVGVHLIVGLLCFPRGRKFHIHMKHKSDFFIFLTWKIGNLYSIDSQIFRWKLHGQSKCFIITPACINRMNLWKTCYFKIWYFDGKFRRTVKSFRNRFSNVLRVETKF